MRRADQPARQGARKTPEILTMILPTVRERLEGVLRHPALEQALDALRGGAPDVSVSGLHDVAKALVAAHFFQELRRPAFVIVENTARAEALTEGIRFFVTALGGNAACIEVLPAFDVFPWEEKPPHPDILERRAAALCRLAGGQLSLVVTPLAASLWKYRSAGEYPTLSRTLAQDDEVGLEEIVGHLEAVGYARTEMVELPGQFAVRGGILDVFSPETLRPVRIEMLGDTVESVREFDPRTQRSIAPVVRTILLPLTEFAGKTGNGLLGGEESSEAMSLFELSPISQRPIVILDEPQTLEEVAGKHRAEANERYDKRSLEDAPAPAHFFWGEEEWTERVAALTRVRFEELGVGPRDSERRFEVMSRPCTRFHGDVVACIGEVKSQLSAGGAVFLTAASTGERERLADICREYEVPYMLGETDDVSAGIEAEAAVETAGLVLLRAPFAAGVAFPGAKFTLYGNADLFDVALPLERPSRKKQTASFLTDFAALKPGDYIVHVDHGIGQFEGLRQIETDGRSGEFMLLRYAEDARLYVPLERMDLVQGYRTVGEAKPALDRLGGTAWTARKTRARKSLEDMADQLLDLYARRKTTPGFAFSPDIPWQREFEDAFEFEETRDQVTAIADIKRDMERAAPMDRLLCGDVGYGKTEVAMRAAFKAVADDKQVAVLAPTTVLAFQHYETFKQRFGPFPVTIEMISRFRNPKQQKEILHKTEAGKIDIVIGTHRLLSKDVTFHDLGLLIVDEEQRFGVRHKERIKQMRKQVDVLTMSATPIPRTLHMSLVGLRDMSVIETPPKDRMAIQTVVASWDEKLIQSAIEQELERGGQVYFVHNRVESIWEIAAKLQEWIPRARITVGHGQMSEAELEKGMLKFMHHDADVLVATTIIENGLDIPLCNTILINRADRHGLSELYQLRGRVGRSNRRAYAYLLLPPEIELTPVARRRLAALKEFSDLGAGFKIAALDLELRGAGNLLGAQQSGQIDAIGFDLYTQMLERTVRELKGEPVEDEVSTAINLGVDIRIPEDYIYDMSQRLRTYKRISSAESEDELADMHAEIADRYGPIPETVENLFEYSRLRREASKLGIISIDREGDRLAVKFTEQAKIDPDKLIAMVSEGSAR